MRFTLSLATIAFAFAPCAALAEDPCSRTPADVIPLFGEPAGNPEEGRTAYMPAGLRVLDHDVSYVLVMRGSDDGPVEEIAYRIKDMTRKIGSGPEASLAKAFDNAFNGDFCTRSKNSSCGVAYDPEKSGGFAGAELNSGSLWLEDGASGPAIPLIRTDYAMTDGAPVFLVCIYEPQ